MVKATEYYANWVDELAFEDIPPEAVTNAKDQLIGILAATYAGAGTAAGQRIIAAVKTWGERPESTVIGGSFKASMRSAALVNSVSAQVLEFDDWVGIIHTGATVVPTAIAVAEALGRSGKDLLVAQIAGNEIAARVGFATRNGRGLGNSHAVHQAEVPLVAGKLLGLNPIQLMDAVGGSCAQAQFPAHISWTSHAKGYLTGMPVYTGITAANIAQFGFGGSHEIIEHPRGYCYEAQGRLSPERLIDDLGTKWYTAEALTIKPYPMCGFTMAATDCVLEIVGRHDFSAEEIETITIWGPLTLLISGAMFTAIDDMYEKIRRGDETGWCWIPLLFDAKYPIAAAFVDREMTPRQYTNERIFDPLVQETLGKIRIKTRIELDMKLGESLQFGAEVAVTLKDGRTFSARTEQHKGGPGKPFDVASKLAIGADGVLTSEQQRELVDAIRNLDQMRDVRELAALFQ